ncbi:MAG TPA: tryptophan--tRNA ligase [Candidatus Paceibacterota bacterium]|nr:tryptophan--tRNA ligase [Candidatus Paceibacterota bacterium]
MSKDKKILLSGIKPSGELHIGNYFGALKQFVDLQDDYKCFFMIADYHALNTLQDAKEMKENIINIALDYLAVGLDPKKAVIFKQSDVSAHTELAWIFEAITTMPYLMRAHAFKDAEAKNKDLNVGTFNYPMLMASDILLYDVDVVPVGQDQKQHIEIARDTAQKFNNIFETETFKLPESLIIESVAVVPGIDGQKMSKSYKNTIPLFAEDEVIQKLVMSIVTDSSGGRPENVYAIHKLFRDEEYLENLYKEHEGKYKDLKEALAEDIKAFVRPFREKREELAKNISYVEKILEEGGNQANTVAISKLIEAKKAIGVL